MKRTWIVLLAVAVALAIAMPAGAKKPDKPDEPATGFKPMACEVDVPFHYAFVRTAGSEGEDVHEDDGVFTLDATEAGGFNETRYTVATDIADSNVLCVTVKLDKGTVKDLRVRWLDCFPVCGLYRATGKDLRSFNDGTIFSAGVSVADWDDSREEWTVAVMPALKSDTARMMVMIGIDKT